MDRSEAATTVLLWQLHEEHGLPAVAEGEADRTFLSLVDEESQSRPPQPPKPLRPLVPDNFLRLEEHQQMDGLRARLDVLATVLRSDEYEELRIRMGPNLLPMTKIQEISAAMERFAVREARENLQRDFEAEIHPPRSTGLRAIMLFSRDGRLLASQGEAKGFDMRALSALVARGEPGSTWSLAHSAGFLVGHGGSRAVLITVFAERAPKNVPVALKASVIALEHRRGLFDASHKPTSPASLMEFLHAVSLLLSIEAT